MRRSKGNDEVQVDVHRNYEIVLNRLTGKFAVLELGELEPVESIQAARAAIEKKIKDLNTGVRRQVLTIGHRYFSNDHEGREMKVGTLTSWTRSRSFGNIEGVISYGSKERETVRQSNIYEDTPENRAKIKRVEAIDREINKLKKEAEKIVDKQLTVAAIAPETKKALEERGAR